MNLLINLTFDEWVRHVFDHPVTEPQWYWQDGAEFWDPTAEPNITVSHLTNLFQNSVATLANYTDAQIGEGLWYLVSNSCSDHMYALKDERVPLDKRLACIRSIYTLFEELFLPRCTATLGDRHPLATICHMWWELIPIHGATLGPDPQATADAILDVLTRLLTLNSISCRKSALWGLGQWSYYDPVRIERIIEQFGKET